MNDRARIYSTIVFLVAGTVCLATPDALLASVGSQGIDHQGTDLLGSHSQIQTRETRAHTPDTEAREHERATWLQGSRLIGFGAGLSATNTWEIIGFRGDRVLAFARDTSAAWRLIELSPPELVGMTWLEHRCDEELQCDKIAYRIRSVDRDTSLNTMPHDASNHDVWLYEIEYTTATSPQLNDWSNVCPKDRNQATRGMFVEGRWYRDGSWRPGGYTFACTTGVIAKCARNWGYKPWREAPTRAGNAIVLRSLHQACTRAARADYCGDGNSHTRDGTVIDMFDIYGLNIQERRLGFAPEAGFAPSGGYWLKRERWPKHAGNAQVSPAIAECVQKRSQSARQDDVLIHVWSEP